MKKILFLLLISGAGIVSFAQQSAKFSLQNVRSKEDSISIAKKAIDYILATPVDTTDSMRRRAERFLFVWMEASEDYMYPMDNSIVRILEEDKFAGYVLLACMADRLFKDKVITFEQIKVLGMKRLVEYATEPENKLQPGYELRKAIKAEQKGKLEEYLMQTDK